VRLLADTAFVMVVFAFAAETVPEPTVCVASGDVCKLKFVMHVPGMGDWTPTATSVSAHTALQKAVESHDGNAIVELLKIREALETRAGDRILVTDSGLLSGRTEGRMVSGKYRGRKVFVNREWVVR
jgi:hypothetical protein